MQQQKAAEAEVVRRESHDHKSDATNREGGYTTDMSLPTLTVEEDLNTATEGEITEAENARSVHFRYPERSPNQLTPRSASPAFSQSSAGEIFIAQSKYKRSTRAYNRFRKPFSCRKVITKIYCTYLTSINSKIFVKCYRVEIFIENRE